MHRRNLQTAARVRTGRLAAFWQDPMPEVAVLLQHISHSTFVVGLLEG
jgi:hypothetical protein